MKRQFVKMAVWAAGLFCLTGCADGDSRQTIYIPGAGAVVKANFYIEDEPYVQPFTVAVTRETYPQLTEYGLPADAVVYLEAEPDLVAGYNARNGTSYEMLPADAFSVSPQVVIKAGHSESEPAAVTVRAEGNIEAFKEYLLPVSIVSVDGAEADDCCQTIYFIFKGTIDASRMELFDRAEWEVTGVSSEEPKEGDWGNSGLKEACLDGNPGTFWSTAWELERPQPPHWIVIDLKQSFSIRGFACQARKEGADGPKAVTIEVSEDNRNWRTAASFEDIPAQGEFRSFFPEAVTGRYLKVTITAVNGGPQVTVSELNLF